MDRSLLEKKQLAELREIASTLDLSGYQRMKKADLVDLIIGAGGPDGNGASEADTSSDDADGGRTRARQRDAGGSSADAPKGSDADASRDSESDSDDDEGRSRNKQRRRKNRNGGGQDGDLEDAEVREGVLDLLPEGYGFLRTTGYLSGSRDVYVSQSFVRRFNLRRGDRVRGPIRSNNRGNDKFPALARVDEIEGLSVDDHLDEDRADFRDLEAGHPTERLRLASDDAPLGPRVLDVVAPLGRGARGLVLAPPRAGRTTLLRQVARAIEAAHDDVHVMVLLIDERPEEITELEGMIDGEVVASAFDRPAEDHTAVAELAIERAKRLVERGRDVVVLVDSLTRLARAYHLSSAGAGRQLPGGTDAAALHPVKRMFAAARNVPDGGSLTILATALTETGSPTDQDVLDELRGTANLQVRLSSALLQQRVFPAIDPLESGAHREESLLDESELEGVHALRAALAPLSGAEAGAVLVERLGAADSNEQFLQQVVKDGLD